MRSAQQQRPSEPTPDARDPRRTRLARRAPFALAFVALAALRLVLTMGQQRSALSGTDYDDALFLDLAAHLVNGEWLGPYHHRTLIKGPGYPLWVAAVHELGLPLYLAEGMLYVGACALLIAALRAWTPSLAARIALAALLLFNPMSYGETALRFTRDAVSPAQSLLVAGGLLGMWTQLTGSGWKLFGWGLLLGIAVGWLWITREEGVWILPAAALAGAAMAHRLWRSAPRRRLARSVLLLLPVLVGSTPVLLVALQNGHGYGVFCVTEPSRIEFRSAVGALLRLEHPDRRRYVTVPRASRLEAYRHSAALRELRPTLEGRRGAYWSRVAAQHTARHTGIAKAELEGEIVHGFFIWALRDAAAAAGHHVSAPEAMRFYARLARELDQACDDGALPCGPRRATLVPRPDVSHLLPALRSLGRGLALLARFDGFGARGVSVGPESTLTWFRALTHDRIAPTRAASGGDTAGLRVRVLEAIAALYQTFFPALAAIWLLLLVGRLAVPEARRGSRMLAVELLLLALLAGRLLLLAYVDVAVNAVVHERLLAALYPLALALVGCALLDAVRLLRGMRLARQRLGRGR